MNTYYLYTSNSHTHMFPVVMNYRGIASGNVYNVQCQTAYLCPKSTSVENVTLPLPVN